LFRSERPNPISSENPVNQGVQDFFIVLENGIEKVAEKNVIKNIIRHMFD
jgi:hypothetical protein